MRSFRRIVVGATLSAVACGAAASPAAAGIWTSVASSTTDEISAIEYQSDQRFWFTTSTGKIFARQPNGSFAQQAAFPGRQFFDIAFQPGGNIGLAAADTGKLYRFNGSSWQPVNLAGSSFNHDCPSNPMPPYPAAAPNANLLAVGWSTNDVAWVASASEGQILKSENGGQTWRDVSRQPDGTCNLEAVVTDVGAITGSAGDVYFTSQGGTLWRTADGLVSHASERVWLVNPLCAPTTVRLGVDQSNPSRVTAVGRCRLLTHWGFSPDGGATRTFTQSSGYDLYDVATANGTMLAVGNGGAIEQSFDGDKIYRQAGDGALATKDWRAVDFASATHAAVGGVTGSLVTTTTANAPPPAAPPPTKPPAALPRPRFSISKRKGVTARRRGRTVVVTVRGRLRPPAGVDSGAACAGTVVITVKKRRRLLTARSASVRKTCRFAKRIKLRRRKVGRARSLIVTLRFQGNAVMGPSSRTVSVRVRR